MRNRLILFLILFLVASPSLWAQLNRTFEGLFNRILVDELQLSPGQHGNHFIAVADLANRTLTPALNSLIAGNISSFPISASSGSVTFDFSSGQPVPVRESLGPIFTETGSTLGKGRLSIGLNHTKLTLDRFRGIPTRDMRFTFTHVDVTGDGTLGESANESDTIDLLLNLNVDATISALYANWGLTKNIDVGIAIPFVDVDLDGQATAEINSFTFAALGLANHNFGADPTNPQLVTTVPYGGSGSGIGDASVRFKVGFFGQSSVQLAFLVDVRFATGDELDFLGSGDSNVRISEILSKKIGNFTSHLNLSYESRQGDLDSDEIEINLGFDQQLGKNITWAVDLLADIDLDDREVIELFPGSTQIVDQVGSGQVVRNVDLSNIPERGDDNAVNASLGFRYAVVEKFVFLANILVPLNDGGLRSEVVPTVGVSYNF